jgi:DNA-directed RNA polymerase subunit RPC12/RpoP
MTVHHIITENDQKNTCPYCGKNIRSKRWKSVFDYNSLYKEVHCTCGKRVTIKMPFMGSGDDSWSKNLDKRIEEVDSESQKK